MGKRSRTKGAAWEREVARVLRDEAKYPLAKRGLGQPRSARECSDVEGTPWWVECKHGKNVSIVAAVRQARDASDGRPICVIAKIDNEKPTVTIDLHDFLLLVSDRRALAEALVAEHVARCVPPKGLR